jgi:hypothetical protein
MTHIDLSFRARFARYTDMTLEAARQVLPKVISNPALLEEVAREHPRKGLTGRDMLKSMEIEHEEYLHAYRVLRTAQTIVIPAAQAEVFKLTAKTYFDGLEYRLPFASVLIQFDQTVPIIMENGMDALSAVLLSQDVITQEGLQHSQALIAQRKSMYDSHLVIPEGLRVGDTINHLLAIFSDMNVRRISWTGGGEREMYERESNEIIVNAWRTIKNLAVGCIGYINCANIYLEKQGGAPDKVNKKRVAKGKTRLDPYYVCKIRGVKYTSTEGAGGRGRGVSFRFDVRGFFRRLPSGKVVWVRPHQRGLQHELYVPKVYEVNKGEV